MPVFDIFSKRRKRASGEMPDVYGYDEIPRPLKVQIVHIWHDVLGRPNEANPSGGIARAYRSIVDILRREYGVFSLSEKTRNPQSPREVYSELLHFFLESSGLDESLDVIELTFKVIDTYTRQWDYRYRQDYDEAADNAIEELNARFKEHAVGYFYSDGTIGRVDSELAHAEIVKPTLAVLRRKEFASAQSEFLSAHAHYREGNNSAALMECYKAFESTMKIICSKHKWPFDTSKGAADLVKVCLANGLIPQYWQSHFSGLRNILESAIPTPRNKQAGHGAGAQPTPSLPNELVAYVLHMTAATILFLTEAERRLS